jgi:hypothetical protein
MFRYSVDVYPSSIADVLVTPERTAEIEALPAPSRARLAQNPETAYNTWLPFAGQGAVVAGEFCVVKSVDPRARTAVVKTRSRTLTVLFSALSSSRT